MWSFFFKKKKHFCVRNENKSCILFLNRKHYFKTKIQIFTKKEKLLLSPLFLAE